MSLPLDDLGLLDAPAPGDGQPKLLAIETIDEDPEQPRQEFDAAALRELAATIEARGVRSPISVRPHPTRPGRWLLNFGARRLRASKLAGKSEIPAFIDRAADAYDQVIENEQREALTPLELALFVQRRLHAGETKAEVARRIGKSKMYVTYATALIDPPDWLLELYRSGRCRGLRELHELRRLDEEHRASVQTWVAGREVPITRTAIDELRLALTVQEAEPNAAPPAPGQLAEQGGADIDASSASLPRPISQRDSGGGRLAAARRVLCAHLDGAVMSILVVDPPPEPGHVYVRPVGGGERTCVDAARLRLLGFIDVASG